MSEAIILTETYYTYIQLL